MRRAPAPRPIPGLARLLTLAALAAGQFGCATSTPLAPLTPSLVKTGELPSPYATQAALADRDHLYAVANTVVIRYDRRTGEETGRSAGDAEHLNQGVLLDGVFLLAHSNYPHKPDRSDIRQLDPRTMALTVFKDFGVTDGSLTWVDRHDGAWWCNFAFYGPDNHRTYLARFDDQWNEIARWTYPRAVIDRMGDASISSGLWHDGSILAIGHSRPELYQLRLPDPGTGSALRLTRIIPSPFPGQGIAHDPAPGSPANPNPPGTAGTPPTPQSPADHRPATPATPGLVGISRPDRTIITAVWQR